MDKMEKNGPPKWPIVIVSNEQSLAGHDALVRHDQAEQVLAAVVHRGNFGDASRLGGRLDACVSVQADRLQVACT